MKECPACETRHHDSEECPPTREELLADNSNLKKFNCVMLENEKIRIKELNHIRDLYRSAKAQLARHKQKLKAGRKLEIIYIGDNMFKTYADADKMFVYKEVVNVCEMVKEKKT